MQVSRSTFGIVCFAALVAAPLGAQQYSRRAENPDIPKSAYPPAGLCRVWLNGVAASQQPAATDCTSAIRNQPANARVLFGDVPGVPAAPSRNLPANTFDGTRNSWSEMRRQGGRTHIVTPAGPPTTVVAPSATTMTPATVRAAVTAPAKPITPPPAQPAGKPE